MTEGMARKRDIRDIRDIRDRRDGSDNYADSDFPFVFSSLSSLKSLLSLVAFCLDSIKRKSGWAVLGVLPIRSLD